MYEVFENAAVGAYLKFEGRTVKVVPDNGVSCQGCLFELNTKHCPEDTSKCFPYCYSTQRKDGVSVKFVEVSNEIKNIDTTKRPKSGGIVAESSYFMKRLPQQSSAGKKFDDLKDVPIGTILEFKGTTIEVVTDDGVLACTGCFFETADRCPETSKGVASCSSSQRTDSTSVKFVQRAKSLELSKLANVGKKFDNGKLRYTLLPFKALTEVVKVLEFGGKKYGVDNWQKVDNAKQRYIDACFRHLIDSREEFLDGESKLPHLAHAVCCLLFVLWFELR